MKPILKTAFLAAAVTVLAPCGTTPRKPVHRPTAAHKVQPVRIDSIDHTEGSQGLMPHNMGLIGAPYHWGDNKAEMSFGCSSMTQLVYKNALGVSLPRTAHDMATASRRIPDSRLKAGDSALFSMGEAHKYSHVGLYIGNGEFIHTPSSDKTVQTGKLSRPFYARNYLGTHTFFTD